MCLPMHARSFVISLTSDLETVLEPAPDQRLGVLVSTVTDSSIDGVARRQFAPAGQRQRPRFTADPMATLSSAPGSPGMVGA